MHNCKKSIFFLQAREVQNTLIEVQPGFKSDLLNKVAQFKKDVDIYTLDYTKKFKQDYF